jgi:hypothetical protein
MGVNFKKMLNISFRPVTQNSWIVVSKNDDKCIGVLSRNPDNSFVMLVENEKLSFDSKDDLERVLGFPFESRIAKRKRLSRREQNYINGYAVDFKKIYPELDHPSGLPTFAKNKNSDVLYCAGYYCLKRKNGWSAVYCSKLNTLSKYEFEGPFQTPDQCNERLSMLKGQKKDK